MGHAWGTVVVRILGLMLFDSSVLNYVYYHLCRVVVVPPDRGLCYDLAFLHAPAIWYSSRFDRAGASTRARAPRGFRLPNSLNEAGVQTIRWEPRSLMKDQNQIIPH
jgi:hypothetical protein